MRNIDFEKLFIGTVGKVKKPDYQNSESTELTRSAGKPKHQNAGSVGLKKLQSGEIQDFEFDSECDLPAVFEMAKSLGMPIGFLPLGEKGVFIGSFIWRAKEPLRDVADGFEVTIDNVSSTKYLVHETNPEFEQIKSDVQDSIENKTRYWFSIIDVEGETPQVVKLTPYAPPPECDYEFESMEFDQSNTGLFSGDDAQDLFDFLQDNSVTAANQSPSLIPYSFVLDGCRERAHKAADMMLQHKKMETEKVWLRAKTGYMLKKVETDRYPSCAVEWDYHVANAVFTGNGYLVLDPSLFSRPVSLSTWRQKLDSGHTLLYKTSWQVFDIRASHCRLDSDPQLVRTNRNLDMYTINLILQWYYFGFPPYSCCQSTVQST